MDIQTIHAIGNSIATVVVGVWTAYIGHKNDSKKCSCDDHHHEISEMSKKIAVLEERSKNEEKNLDRLEQAIDKLEETLKDC